MGRGAGQCGLAKRIGTPAPTCATAGAASPCCDLRHEEKALGWKSMLMWLALVMQGPQVFGLVGTSGEGTSSVGRPATLKVWSEADFTISFYPF